MASNTSRTMIAALQVSLDGFIQGFVTMKGTRIRPCYLPSMLNT
jgi:hypothetical protein